jgi:hypothetical protein
MSDVLESEDGYLPHEDREIVLLWRKQQACAVPYNKDNGSYSKTQRNVLSAHKRLWFPKFKVPLLKCNPLHVQATSCPLHITE